MFNLYEKRVVEMILVNISTHELLHVYSNFCFFSIITYLLLQGVGHPCRQFQTEIPLQWFLFRHVMLLPVSLWLQSIPMECILTPDL